MDEINIEENSLRIAYQKQETNNKLLKCETEIKQYKEDLISKTEEICELTKHLRKLGQQIEIYKHEKELINQENKKRENDNDTCSRYSLESENDSHEQNESSSKLNEDNLIIYQEIQNELKSLIESFKFPRKIHPTKPQQQVDPPVFQNISVFFFTTKVSFNNSNNDSDFTFYQQTFRITKRTTVGNFLYSVLEFWNKSETEIKQYHLNYIDDNLLEFEYSHKGEFLNDLFLIQKTQIKIPQLALIHESIMNKLTHKENTQLTINDIINEDKNDIIQKNQNINSEITNSFILHFAGVVNFIKTKYINLKNFDKIERQQDSNKGKFIRKTKYQFFMNLFKNSSFIWIFMITLFSFLNINEYSDVYKHYVETHFIERILRTTDQKNVSQYLFTVLKNFSSHNNTIPYLKPINKLRLTFYLNLKQNCNNNYLSINSLSTCYKSKYKENEQVNNFDIDIFKSNTIDEILQENTKNNIYYFLNTSNTSKSQNIATIAKRLEKIFKNLSSDYSYLDKFNLNGYFGTYHGKYKNESTNTVEILLSLNHMSIDLLNITIYILANETNKTYPMFFTSNKTKAVSISMTLYSLISETYYYIGMLFELDSLIIEPVDMKIIPFYPNIKNNLPKGKMIFILDIFRLLFVIILFIIAIYKTYLKYIKNKSKNQNSFNYFKFAEKTFNLSFILDILIFIFIILSFDTKKRYLYQSNSFFGKLKTDVDDDSSELPEREYYPIAHSYELTLIYESIILIILFLRVIPLFSFYSRIKMLLHYIHFSLYKVSSYFFIYIGLIIFFAIYAHVLIGTHKQHYKNFSSSLLFVLLLSLSHYDLNAIFENGDTELQYIVVFMFLFYFIVVFFVMSSFFGIFMENYRLTALKYGNNYSMRFNKKIAKLYDLSSVVKEGGDLTTSKIIKLQNESTERSAFDEQNQFNNTITKLKDN